MFAANVTTEEMIYPIALNLSAGAVAIEKLGDDKDGIISGVGSNNEYAPLFV